ncbi:armadillo-like helical domain-containing protein [Tanacetum coccineum]
MGMEWEWRMCGCWEGNGVVEIECVRHAVNMTLCRSLLKMGGIEIQLVCIDDAGVTGEQLLADDPSVIQEVMTIICTLCLRSPGNATLAIEAGAGDLAIQSMQTFPEAYQLQKNSCLMIRNLVARNPENRTLLLGNGIEKIIRKAKENHKSCKDAATAALRDLGLDNYNS